MHEIIELLKDELEVLFFIMWNDKFDKKRFEEELGNLLSVIKLLNEVTPIDIDHVLQSAENNLLKIRKPPAEGK